MIKGTETGARVLIVDDDPAMCETLVDLLESSGLFAASVEDGAAMSRAIAADAYDLLLIDLRLRREDGLTIARSVRETSDVPIIILTARVEESDKLVGLELGADDYVTKPFSPKELVARVRAVFRRVDAAAAPADVIRAGDVTLDRPRMQAAVKDQRRTGRAAPAAHGVARGHTGCRSDRGRGARERRGGAPPRAARHDQRHRRGDEEYRVGMLNAECLLTT